MSRPRDTLDERLSILRGQRGGAPREPMYENDPAPREPMYENDPAPREPMYENDPAPREPMYENDPASQEPMYENDPAPREPMYENDPAPREPMYENDPASQEREREVETERSNGDGGPALNGRNGTAGATHVAFARMDALSAAIRYPLLVLLPIVILGALGGVLAKRNHVSYSAEAQVLIAAPAPGTSGELPGVVQAEQSLASIYAREVGFNPIVMPMARKLHLTPGYIASHLTATPDPAAPIIKVSATAPDAQQAITMANGSGLRLAKFVNSQTQSSTPSNSAFSNYGRAANTLEHARAHLNQVSGQNGNSPAAVAAQAQVQEDQLIVQALGNQYQNAIATTQNTPTLSVFQSATDASSNRGSNLEIYIFGGIVAGLVIGVALATLAANRKTIREARRRVATA